ncbi:hypothetical protein AX16_005559 [Volvariella volvacea WC 439]|nr:hypothetical protein AX16_005559 [Volvariella volvacea WC 439]
MCGIFFSARWVDGSHTCSGAEGEFSSASESLRQVNAARGPDAQKSYYVLVRRNSDTIISPISTDTRANETNEAGVEMEIFASELQLRGDTPITQPHVEGGDLLCWNGEIFDGLNISTNENDGVRLFRALRTISTPKDVVDILGSVEGPYAFVFYHGASRKIFFGRDPLGRRSLLIHRPNGQYPFLFIASTTAGGEIGKLCEEVSPDGLHCLDVQSWAESSSWNDPIHPIPRAWQGSRPERFACPKRLDTTPPPDNLETPSSLAHIPAHLINAVNGFIEQLDRSVQQHVQDIPKWSLNEQGSARVAVLFSGGIDSTIIAYLASKHIPADEPIDLLNVAFENPRKVKSRRERKHNGTDDKVTVPEGLYQVPDRLTGLEQLEELRALCPGRIWNFSLAIALYFASRGVGQVRSSPEEESVAYHSKARVILNGLGADELLGGYSRHRTTYARGGWMEIVKELQLDIDRIPSRNLGRDDRIISSHGKETRHPFLSLSLVSYIASLPAYMKLDPRLELGFGDKLLLRLATYKLGLVSASGRKKRAMQFGSHSARMEGEKRGDLLLEE